MPSLTRIEAVDRAGLLTIGDYRIFLDLTAGGPHFVSDTTICFSCRDTDAATFVDVKALSTESAVLNGEPIDSGAVTDGRLPLKGLAVDNVLRVVATMAYSSDGEGLHRNVDPADGETYLYAMSFLDAAPRWFACFDQPDLKARYQLEVKCPPAWTVIGNGPATHTGPDRWSVAPTSAMSTYFVTLVAGPYHSILAEHDGIKLGLHARASLAQYLDAETEDMLSVTRSSFDRIHELFGVRYPFGEYHQAFVPDFNAGAMENPGCVTFRDQYVFRSAVTHAERGVRAGTIAHEMAHMWFGDLVTMRWWDDLWLNESFAEYIAQRVCSEVTPYPAWVEFGIHRKDWGYVADQSESRHPVAGNGSADAAAALADFDGISYAKGASVLKQLATRLGDEVFFAGLGAYFADHAYGNAEFKDLIDAWTAAGADDLDSWAGQWLRTAGLDTLTAQAQDGVVTVRRTAPDGSDRPHTVRVAGFDGSGNLRPIGPITISSEPLHIETSTDVELVVADGDDDTWAKVRFGQVGWKRVGELLPLIDSAPTRVVLYNAIRDAVRDGEVDPAEALEILLGAVAAETELLVAAEMLRFATRYLAGPFCPAAQRSGRLASIAAVSALLLGRALPASDAQLEAARALIRTTDDAAMLRGWLSDQGPAGLAIDDELRWAGVHRLAAIGAVTDSEIAAELARDRSSAGTEHAARARALRPEPAAKTAAWRLLTEPSDTPATELYRIAEAFFHPAQEALTAGYVQRFFAEMPDTARHRTGWALGRVVLLAYPTAAASAETLELARSTLVRVDLDPAVRRSLVDGTDVLRRAVSSLRRFTGALGSPHD